MKNAGMFISPILCQKASKILTDEELNKITIEDLPEWVIHPQSNEGLKV